MWKLIGFIKPKVLLPDVGYTERELNMVIQHELTHFKRFDTGYKLLLTIANSLHFFNPFIYLMVKQANRDLEYSCDEAVVRNGNMEYRKEYSMAILKTMQKGERLWENL